MFHLFFALFMAFACPKYNNHNCHGTATTQNAPPPDEGGGTGGDGGHIDPDKP